MDPNATFVIACGLGGVGRAAAQWMASRGAKNLVLLSRFGPRSDVSKELCKELQLQGVRVETPACDVTDLSRMGEIFERLSMDVQKLANSLVEMQDPASIDRHKQLQMYGVDSLLAVELRNWIAKELKADLAVFETQDASTLSTLSVLVAARSTIKNGESNKQIT